MGKHVLLIDGHPDRRAGRFIHALAHAYRRGADGGGHAVRSIVVSELEFPLLATKQDFEDGALPLSVRSAQADIQWADHIVILYPLWLGSMPALLKGFFEQVLRPGFAFATGTGKGLPRKLLQGKSARIVVTMGMPALFYILFYRAHSVRSLKRNVLAFCGIHPVRSSVVGMVEGPRRAREKWLRKMEDLGCRAD